MSKILGIDLGTTFSAMAVVKDGEPKIIESKEGGRTIPSVIALSKNNERLVGVLARRQQITNPENTIYSAKRLIGREFSDPVVQKDKKSLSYQIQEGNDKGVEIKLGEKWYKPAEISAMVLQKIKKDAEDYLGEEIKDAIITCPAYFDDSQRKATKIAGEIAGFNVRRVINEPTAAALAYGLTRNKDQQVVVYDFGGGTFDISVLDIGDNAIEVKATAGDTHLGGDDFDQKIIDWVIEKFKKDEGIDLAKDPLALQRLKETAERAKIELSSAIETEINLPFITSDASGPKHLYYKLSRSQFEGLVQEYIDKSIDLVKRTIQDAKMKIEDIEDVVLVGGQTRMPKIQEEVKKLLNKEPHKGINPDEVVAIGASIQGEILSAKDEGRKTEGDVKDVLLLDVTPLSLGIETYGSVNTVLISKNTTVPTAKSQVFSTAADNQPSVEIHVLQGERPMAPDNKSLGKFILDGIPPAPRGIPQVEVTFDIDANGILNVSAKDKATNKSQSIKIEGSCGISKEEAERMKKEAEEHAQEDKKKQELIELKNKAEGMIYSSEKTIKDLGEKIPEETKKQIQEKTDDLKKVLGSGNVEELKQKTDDLEKTIQEIATKAYKEQSEQATQENPNPEEKPNDNPEEGEYKEKE